MTTSRQQILNHCAAKKHSTCVHCGNNLSLQKTVADAAGNLFCCGGCHKVFSILEANGLSYYYALREGSSKITPVANSADSYSYLDAPQFKEKYCGQENSDSIKFYLEGIHCVACIWLIEKLPHFCPDVLTAKLDFARSTVMINKASNAKFSTIANLLADLGYKPHPLENNQTGDKLEKLENRTWLTRIGIAGASAGNIMLLAIAIYAGADGQYANAFRWLSFLIFLPSASYCALPFYRSASSAIRTRTLSIDVPISLALFTGSAVSIKNLLIGSDHIYFDSLSSLVFLLLSTRYLLRRIQQKTLSNVADFQFLTPPTARRYNLGSGTTVEVTSESLVTGDLISVLPAEFLPADGIIHQGSGFINASLLTGEATPQKIRPGDAVFSGTQNCGDEIIIEVKAVGFETKLGKILRLLEESPQRNAPIVLAADRISKWFLLSVCITAFVVLVVSGDLAVGFNRALAVMIVTCPCALALATPLTMTLALEQAMRRGILIKSANVIERIAKIKEVILDKTGTLTTGTFEVLGWREFKVIPGLKHVVLALEKQSRHPIAKSLVRYCENHLDASSTELLPPVELHSFREVVGLGVAATIDGKFYEIKGVPARNIENPLSDTAPLTTVGIFCDSVLVASVQLGDELRENSAELVQALQRQDLSVSILSGDHDLVVKQIASIIGVNPMSAYGEADPIEKKDFMSMHPQALMIGDGANDALALSSAYVSAAVHGSMEASLRAADVYLSAPGVTPIYELILLSKNAMRLIYRNFAFSLLYNLAGGIAAITGHITPLAAALLMPISALTVLVSSILGSKRLMPPSKKPLEVL